MTLLVTSVSSPSAEPTLKLAATASLAPASPTSPDSQAVAQFERGLNPTSAAPSSSNTSPPSARVTPNAAVGDRILQGLQRTSEAINSRWSHVNASMNTQDISAHRLLSLQLDVAQFTFQMEMLGKFSSKPPQQLDQLLHTQ
ncbi:hypothetical protein PIN31115_04516 [Pandoraea iniqua]|uniref:Uncharacterized protein n=1 Tax=Pandoraea iniqua TaxID=2508288 RepID=A0A5E4YHZ0_9BURK|nr:EscI/YscI/HrpB family type III secretion system inner rod protein [Pandoraea iniqua]VVE48344.1 hypothetical protein PIN31115_04516 [Pandoraea iniqua]